jgi:hypothetical protein
MALKNSNEAAVSELLATEQGLDESSRLDFVRCSISISRITRRFVCMNCADTNLCGNCYSKHQSGKTSTATCANHFFVEYSFLDEPPSRLLIGVGVEMTTTGFNQDLKPENFLVRKDPSDSISLGKVPTSISYSAGDHLDRPKWGFLADENKILASSSDYMKLGDHRPFMGAKLLEHTSVDRH